MSLSNAYIRAFLAGAVLFGAIGYKMVSRHPGGWSGYPVRNLAVVVVSWIVTSSVLGALASRFERLRSWWGIGLGTVAGSLLVPFLMLMILEKVYGLSAPPEFKTPQEMMTYFASEASKWVKKDRGINLDYSFDSIKIIEEELGRISKDLNKTNPPPGTVGTAMGYGAYVGEVIRRRRDGGSWSVHVSAENERYYALITKSNTTLFPVVWCWKRLMEGEAENVYDKARIMTGHAQRGGTNAP